MRKLNEISILDGGQMSAGERVVHEALDDGAFAASAGAHDDHLEAVFGYQLVVVLRLLLLQLPARLLQRVPLAARGRKQRSGVRKSSHSVAAAGQQTHDRVSLVHLART